VGVKVERDRQGERGEWKKVSVGYKRGVMGARVEGKGEKGGGWEGTRDVVG